MLKGAVSIFEGLEPIYASARGPQSVHAASNGTHITRKRGWCGCWQALMLSNSQESPTLVELSARPPETEEKQQVEQIGSSAGERQLIYRLDSKCSPWQRPHSIHQDAVLLQVYYQSSTQTTCGDASSNGRQTVHMPLPCSTPCWLALYKSGKHLQLYSVCEYKQQRQHDPHLLLELQHESFSSLQPHQCWLVEGPVIILQVQQEQLILLAPAAAQVAAASADVVSSRAPGSNCPAGIPNAVVQLELDLPPNDILDCLDQGFMQQLMEMSNPAAAAVPVLQLVADSHTSCRHLSAVQPWRLLHCHTAAAGVQLLLGMQVAVAPDNVWTHHHSYQHQQQQQQQQQEKLSLLVWLEVKNAAAAAADVAEALPAPPAAAPEVNSSDLEILHCWSTEWPDTPACAAMLHDQQQRQQLIVIASSTGALQLLSCGSQRPTKQQMCMPQLAPGHSSSTLLLQASGNVPGTPDSIHLLPQVVAAGGVHRNAVCVLHALSSSNSSSVTAAPKCVTLLVQQGEELQAVAQVPDAAAVLVPGNSAPLGLLCPWQQQQQQLQQRDSPELHHAADDTALQLAALILQAEPAAIHTVIGLHCYAKLDCSRQTPAVPSAIGLLQQLPPVLQQLQQQGETSAAHAASAAASNELRSLQTMLAVLEARWQQEFLDLAALQQKFTQGRRMAAAAHKHLCQLAADTIQSSSIRQYNSPLTQLDATAALKAYQVGRSILQEQLKGSQQQQSNLGGLLDCQLQLTVELISCKSQLLEDRLQLTVRLKPVLSMHQQQEDGRGLSNNTSSTSTAPGGSSSWWGPLLQPCHAEVLMWHADMSPLTSQSSWRWDAVEGVIMLQAEVPAAALLNVANGAIITSTGSAVQHKQSRVTGQHTADIDADEYVGVARSVAAAVSSSLNTAVVTRDAGCSTEHTSSRCRFAAESGNSSSASNVQLYSAVAVAACCSKQAVAHAQSHQPNTTQHLSGAAATDNRSHVEESIMLRSQLLTPATALLHLPAVTVSIQQLLLQQLTPAAPQAAAMQHQQQHAAMADRKDGVHTLLQAEPGQQQQHQGQVTPSGAGIPCSELQPIPTGFTNTDVIPPTPCEDDIGGLAHGSADGYLHELVVEDSQPEDEPEQRGSHQMQHDHNMTDAAGNSVAAIDAAGNPTATAAAAQHCQLPDADETRQRAPLYQRMLLLQGPAAMLQQVPFVLVQQLGFCVPAAGLPAGYAGDMATMQQLQLQRLVAALQGLSRQQTGLVHIKLQPHAASTGGSCSCQDVMQLVWFSSELVHVELMASSSSRLRLLQQLLHLAIDSIPEGGSVKCQCSPLSDQRHASYLAATNTLTETVHLHCKLIEETLQQVHQQQHQQRPSKNIVAAAQSGLNDVIAARGDGVTGVKRPAADGLNAPAATHVPLDVVGAAAADGSVLYVDSLRMDEALSSCWVSLYESQADVDLAMSQLQLAGE